MASPQYPPFLVRSVRVLCAVCLAPEERLREASADEGVDKAEEDSEDDHCDDGAAEIREHDDVTR
jgi:hypothetical protein